MKKFIFIILFSVCFLLTTKAFAQEGYGYNKIVKNLNGKNAVVHVFSVNPKKYNIKIRPAYASVSIRKMHTVLDIATKNKALVAINAAYYKTDVGIPLGASIMERKVVTGPLYDRVVFGVTSDNEFKMAKIKLLGKVLLGKKVELNLFNINQPIICNNKFSIYTPEWGAWTPKTSVYFSHIVVENYKVKHIYHKSIPIPPNGFVIVGPTKLLPKDFKVGDYAYYETHLAPDDWFDVYNAVGGGPYLVKNGKIFVDKQNFSNGFFIRKEPRTAVGYTKEGVLLMVVVDGRTKNSSGATLSELARVMYDLGAYNAMNLDGGTSTQMVINGKIINTPPVKGGAKVSNALIITERK